MPSCTISYPREFSDIHPTIRGAVTSIGANPNASVRIFRWDEATGRMTSFDRLVNASYEEDKHTGQVEVTGRSEMLVLEQNLSDQDATVTLKLIPKGCKGCR